MLMGKGKRTGRSQQWRGERGRLYIAGDCRIQEECEGRSRIQNWGEGVDERFEYIQCLFCVTGREAGVVRTLEKTEGVLAVFPQKVKPVWVKNDWVEELFPLFPGYVFVYSHSLIPYATLCADRNVLRVLTYDKEGNESCLNGPDRAFAEMLLRTDGVVGTLSAVQEGSYVRVNEGALRDFNGRVVKVDKRKRLAKVEMDILGDRRAVWLAFRLLESNN